MEDAKYAINKLKKTQLDQANGFLSTPDPSKRVLTAADISLLYGAARKLMEDIDARVALHPDRRGDLTVTLLVEKLERRYLGDGNFLCVGGEAVSLMEASPDSAQPSGSLHQYQHPAHRSVCEPLESGSARRRPGHELLPASGCNGLAGPLGTFGNFPSIFYRPGILLVLGLSLDSLASTL